MRTCLLGVLGLMAGVMVGCGPSDAVVVSSEYVSDEAEGTLGRELVVNGTFEQALTGWSIGGTRSPIASTAEAHSGERSLRLGATSVEAVGESWASQRVSIPQSATAARLSFYWLGSSREESNSDWQGMQVRDEQGVVLLDALHVTNNDGIWRQRRIDVSNYKGRTLELYFNVHAQGSGSPTTLWVDDVRLSVSESSTGGAGTEGRSVSVHTTMGIPDNSTPTLQTPDKYLLVKPQYVASYNSTRRIPNWVSWELNLSELGNTNRDDSFRADPQVPSSLEQAADQEYVGSGYDRGHQCPSEDRTTSSEDNKSTFYMTNVVPQEADLNRGPWKGFESYLRSLARGGWQVYIIAGSIVGSSPKTIGPGIVVPDASFKVAVLMSRVADGPAQVTSATRVIAVTMPNDGTPVSGHDWETFRTSVDSIEAATGLDLLSDIPKSLQEQLEARVDVQ